MAHIHTGPREIDETMSACVIRLDLPEPALLLHEHRKLHTLRQVGGHRELRHTPWQTVLKEVFEETGYTPEQLSVLQPRQRLRQLTGPTLHPLPFCENTHDFPGLDHRHTDRVYAFTTDTMSAQKPKEGESTDFIWVNAGELAALSAKRIKQDIREIGLYALTVCAAEWERVPATEFAI